MKKKAFLKFFSLLLVLASGMLALVGCQDVGGDAYRHSRINRENISKLVSISQGQDPFKAGTNINGVKKSEDSNVWLVPHVTSSTPFPSGVSRENYYKTENYIRSLLGAPNIILYEGTLTPQIGNSNDPIFVAKQDFKGLTFSNPDNTKTETCYYTAEKKVYYYLTDSVKSSTLWKAGLDMWAIGKDANDKPTLLAGGQKIFGDSSNNKILLKVEFTFLGADRNKAELEPYRFMFNGNITVNTNNVEKGSEFAGLSTSGALNAYNYAAYLNSKGLKLSNILNYFIVESK